MSVSKKNKRITLQEPNLIPNGQGGRKPPTGTNKFIDVATVWAEFWKPKTVTIQATGAILGELTYNLIIWRRSDVRKGWQVLYGTKVLTVEHAYDHEKNETMIVCREVVK